MTNNTKYLPLLAFLVAESLHAKALVEFAPADDAEHFQYVQDAASLDQALALNSAKDLIEITDINLNVVAALYGLEQIAEIKKLRESLQNIIGGTLPSDQSLVLSGTDQAPVTSFKLSLPLKKATPLLKSDVDASKLKSLTIEWAKPVLSNLSVKSSRELFKKVQPLVYDNYLEVAKKEMAEFQTATVVPDLRRILEPLFASGDFQVLHNANKEYSNDDKVAYTHMLASGVVAYGFSWGGNSPIEPAQAETLFHRLLKMAVSPVNIRDTGLLEYNRGSEKCDDDEMALRLINFDLVDSPGDDFCAKLSTGKSNPIDNAYYSTSSFQYLQAQQQIRAYRTLDGKEVGYRLDPKSTPEDPIFKLVVLN